MAETSKARPMSAMAHLKLSIIEVKAEENSLAHALVIAVARATNDPDYQAYRKGQKILPKVRELLQMASDDLSRGGEIPQLQAFQRHLSEYRIVVYSGTRCENIMFDGQVATPQRINLLYDGQHYHVIANLTAAMAMGNVCPACSNDGERGAQHTCDASCDACSAIPPCIPENAMNTCGKCNRQFRNAKCFDNHKKLKISGETVCKAKRRCRECDVIMKEGDHECNKRFCTRCQKNRELGHMCYMPPHTDKTPSSDKVLYVFYNFQTTQDTKYTATSYKHVPNLVCVQQFCALCEDDANVDADCQRCGIRKHSFWIDPVDELIFHTLESRPWADRVVAIAHNAKSFDLHFVLNRLLRMKMLPELIMNGLKIIRLEVEKVTWLDSKSYLDMPLRKLPEAFGLTVQKSWYPHLFNTAEYMNYKDRAPDVAYYDGDMMHEIERKEFLSWYETNGQTEVFDNRRMLELHCQTNVTVLREACQSFRKHFLQIGDVEVFLESMTIASACNKLFRKKFLQPDRIGLIPARGYTDNRNQIKKAIAWLLQEEREKGKRILHGRNGKELQLPELPDIRVDGLCEETRTVYEFNGCYSRGHTCMPFRDLPVDCGSGTLAERFEQTMFRLKRIKQAGYKLEVKWECEFDPPEDIRVEEERLPLRTRDALYGGRTEAMRLHYKVKDGEETIQYVDVISLYPWVCKYFKFPVGHPTIHSDCEDIPAMLKKEGLVRCTVLPPRRLYHPVLPYKCNKRLVFCLCRTCAESGSQEQCRHDSDSERTLTATWVVDEVRLAVQHGYDVRKIHEFYEYEVTNYNRDTGEGGHFVQYINTFLKLKAEASGYPGWVHKPEDEDRYIASFLESQRIELDKAAIQKNESKRGLAKLCLNSFWGKLSESSNRPQNKIIADPQKLYQFIATPDREITKLLFADDEVVWVKWKYVEEEDNMPAPCHTNEVIGAYVTTGARLELYTYLDTLKEKAIYCDTDSVFYIQNCGQQPALVCGDKLGDMKNELGPDEYIQEFVSGGRKNYAYKIVNARTSEEKTVCKVSGITPNYANSQLVNFESIKGMILGTDARNVITVRTERNIKRKMRTGDGSGPSGADMLTIVSEPKKKCYRVSFNNRRRLDDFDSVPFGYIQDQHV